MHSVGGGSRSSRTNDNLVLRMEYMGRVARVLDDASYFISRKNATLKTTHNQPFSHSRRKEYAVLFYAFTYVCMFPL